MSTILLVAPLSFSLLFAVGSTSTPNSLPYRKLFPPRLLFHHLLTLLFLFLFSHIPFPPTLHSTDMNTITPLTNFSAHFIIMRAKSQTKISPVLNSCFAACKIIFKNE
jgi:hypothetical protein